MAAASSLLGVFEKLQGLSVIEGEKREVYLKNLFITKKIL